MKQTKHMIEIESKQNLAGKPHLINHLNRIVSHPRIRKCSLIPINNY